MSAKIVLFPNSGQVEKALSDDAKDVAKLSQMLHDEASAGRADGLSVTVTHGGKIIHTFLAGELKRDKPLAVAAANRLMDRIEWGKR